MENAQALTAPRFAAIDWSIDVDAFLLPAFDGDANLLHRCRERVGKGDAQLLGVFDGDAQAGALVIASEGDEGVILAAGGEWKGGGIIAMLLPVIELGFRNVGRKACRIETFRRGLMAKIAPLGYRPAFVAFRKEF